MYVMVRIDMYGRGNVAYRIKATDDMFIKAGESDYL